MNFSIRELRAFLYVAQFGSFTRAAEKMYVTQAGLSTMVRCLEEHLNCRLFDRTTRAVSLTEAGQVFFPVASKILEELSEVGAKLQTLNATVEQTLRVGATPLVCSGFLPAICQEFMRARPEVTLEVVEIPFPEVHAQVEAGYVDLGFCVDVLRQKMIERHPIFPVSLALVSKSSSARKSSARRGPSCVRWVDLPDMPVIALKSDDPLQKYIDKHLARVGRLTSPSMAVGTVDTQIAMVQAGLGIAIIPSLALRVCAHSGLEARLLTDPDPDLEFCCLSKSGRRRTDATNSFIALAEKMFAKSFNAEVLGPAIPVNA